MMKEKPHSETPASDGRASFTRRRFVSSCSACAACFALNPGLADKNTEGCYSPAKKMKIHVIYSLHSEVQTQPDWPNTGFDFRPAITQFNQLLASRFRKTEFLSSLASGEADARKITETDKSGNIDGYIVYQMNCWNRVIQTVATTGKPVLYVDFQFGGSGGFLVYTSAFLRESAGNIGFVASSRDEDILEAVNCMQEVIRKGAPGEYGKLTAMVRMKLTPGSKKYTPIENKINFISADECIRAAGNSRILAVRDQNSSQAAPVFGIPLEYISFAEVNKAWSDASKDESLAVAERWKNSSEEVDGVTFETLVNSAAMYLGMKSVLSRHNANAITINCLGGYYGGHIHAYPCLGFHELCNEGLVGACECDISSTATMVGFSLLSGGRPGFISDPVIDTSKRQIIYAHCVAPNRVFGPKGPSNPFRIMTHSEDRMGASVRSVLPLNYLTTTLEINNNRKEILLHQAVAVDNDPDDRACRTKLCAEPAGDIEKLFTMWDRWGWHRVTFYGDFRAPAYELAGAMGWKVIEEA
jgi:hypothetical protein